MPVVVNPGFVLPPDVDPVVSPDRQLTAIVDPAHAGVLLRADFDDSVPDAPAQPEKVLRRNLVPDSSFETGVSQWTSNATTLTRDTSWSVSGSASMRVKPDGSSFGSSAKVGSSSSMPFGMKAGKTYTISGTARLAAPQTGNLYTIPRRIYCIIYESGRSVAWLPSVSAPNEAGVTRLSMTVALPADASGLEINLYNGATNSADNSVWWDDVLIEESATVSPYFDGNSLSSGTKRYRYASDGTSEEYIPATPFIPGKPGTVAKVRFERGDGTPVRSGDPAWAPGGWAHAYDHEAPLGVGVSYRAVPILWDGSEGAPSDLVGVSVPGLSDGYVWLKPVANPNAAMRLRVEPLDRSFAGRVDTTSIAGSRFPAASWDVLEAPTAQLRLTIRDRATERAFLALLDEGPALAQFPVCAGVDDFYFLREQVQFEEIHWDGYPVRRYTVPMLEIDRPPTVGAPLLVPGVSYDSVAHDYDSYDQVTAQVGSYNQLLEV